MTINFEHNVAYVNGSGLSPIGEHGLSVNLDGTGAALTHGLAEIVPFLSLPVAKSSQAGDRRSVPLVARSDPMLSLTVTRVYRFSSHRRSECFTGVGRCAEPRTEADAILFADGGCPLQP